jgi:Prokaryotic E2 family E
MLPTIDTDYLSRFPGHTVSMERGMVCVVIPEYPLPNGLNRPTADLLLRLAPGYPDIAPDMWWFSPDIVRADGAVIRATEAREAYLGRTWQRWSRHFAAGQWQSGIDCIESYLALVRSELSTAALAKVA